MKKIIALALAGAFLLACVPQVSEAAFFKGWMKQFLQEGVDNSTPYIFKAGKLGGNCDPSKGKCGIIFPFNTINPTVPAGSYGLVPKTDGWYACPPGTPSICVLLEAGANSRIDLDLDNDQSLESTGLTEFATANDANNIVTNPSADKVLFDMAQNWPVCDIANVVSTRTTTYIYPSTKGGNSVAAAADEQCRCYKFPLSVGITDLDTVALEIQVADANDTGTEIGIYSSDGATRYFQAAITVTSATTVALTNTDAAPLTMLAGDYWFCWSRADDTNTDDYNIAGGTMSIRTALHTETCTGGAMPTTLTPSVSFGTLTYPNFSLADE